MCTCACHIEFHSELFVLVKFKDGCESLFWLGWEKSTVSSLGRFGFCSGSLYWSGGCHMKLSLVISLTSWWHTLFWLHSKSFDGLCALQTGCLSVGSLAVSLEVCLGCLCWSI